jgi:hypothetical protein
MYNSMNFEKEINRLEGAMDVLNRERNELNTIVENIKGNTFLAFYYDEMEEVFNTAKEEMNREFLHLKENLKIIEQSKKIHNKNED